ncbi:DUF1573 domain-containing protein [Ornithobacterium rhinotracheale]|uniref:DUF1573 domain-containing protein n=1 Tax=Ornithobacterium rhinotracheale TaxID=28251 RepID=A0A3R5XST6_ORNRH|nr:DUF1573 domain-containing protein [Ornithobacterium rhinotracheale]MRJ08055.1 DUF1573 domain-containing protein [Ornithobacterium rhinotracheale]MRJ11420.1 DUF1573 domain-containing protein [Ornithobacterium rhinotracheale]QAR30318.1 DUF1573 domain-containing protein [Ornithobacterium rhinotracheale]UOH78438.1 DUF1573 domain-containing protein [Ornithobacterium rhinotracheale]
MKRVKIVALALFASLAVVSCKKETKQEQELETQPVENTAVEQEEEPTVDPATAPTLVLAQEIYDFGDVKAGETAEQVITFKNEGRGPLIIKKAQASCGCTVPEYDQEPVPVGGEGKLTVKYKAPEVNGKVIKEVTLTTNTVKGRETFKITANVVGGKEREAAPVAPAPNL